MILPTMRTTKMSPGWRRVRSLRHHPAVGASDEHGERGLRFAELGEQITLGAVDISMEAQNAIDKPVHGPPRVRQTPQFTMNADTDKATFGGAEQGGEVLRLFVAIMIPRGDHANRATL